MTRDLIILGCGVHGGEMAEIVDRVNAVKPTWNLIGFLAPQKHAAKVGKTLNGRPILGAGQDLGRYPSAAFVPDNEYNDPLDLSDDRLVSLIDPSVFVSRTARIGGACVIYPHCYIGLNAVLGRRVFSLAGAVINHDDHLEDNVVLCTNVSLAGYVHVEAGCYLGQACTVRQSLRIGKGSLIGMGAVVIKDIPPNSVMVGNPARRLRDRNPRPA